MQFFPFMADSSGLSATQVGRTATQTIKSTGKQAGGSFAALFEGQKEALRPEFFQEKTGKSDVPTIWDKSRSGLKGLVADSSGRRFSSVLGKATGAEDANSEAIADLRSILSGKGAKSKSLKETSSLKMTREDFAALKDGLKEAGLSEADIEALAEKISSAEGLTWGTFVTSLSDKLATLGKNQNLIAIGDLESRELQTLFQKIGFTTEQAESLLSDLRSGKTTSVWKTVSDKLASLPADATIDLSRSELGALAKVSGLSGTGAVHLLSLLGDAQSATLSAVQLKTVMGTLKSEVAADLEHAKGSGKQLMTLVNDVLAEAGEKASNEQLASDRSDNSVRNKKILGEESRRERAQQRTDGAQADRSSDQGSEGHAERVLKADPNASASRAATVVAAGKGDAQADSKGDSGKDAKGDGKAEAKGVRDGLAARNGQVTGDNAESGAKDSTGDGGATKDSDSHKKAWGELWGKVKVEGTHAQAAAVQMPEAVSRTESAARADALVQKWGQSTSGRMMQQVESGLLKNMGEGRKQLTLELNPGDLGKLSVILQAKDGEVSVMFRAEHQDTGRILSEQLSQLKVHLENQGIKVGKMEVQTQLQDQDLGQGWQGADQHNMTQAQKNFIEKRGILRMLRQDGIGVAQELLNDPETARIAQDGLYVVA
ncbi:flagellar hook-length control protein FliK [Desulfovibrio ferrophilus]|uniref:Flagellar hook-length control protein n=1 Tax=Desulfovibrio ferrophilus TaxID=241368 RepID=A0A2Z6B068_9BACT|nr:flagellar hook-length control protein FliK [Desulfovibrio ferrophilus]BBD08901.1 flagellar hook-length control protein [Desulfovibrio ferrophilus]